MSETDLRWRLRQLPSEIAPERDLWPGIATAIAAPRPQPLHRRHPWLTGLAMAASMVLAVGLVWRLVPSPAAPTPAAADPTARVVSAEAKAMTIEYHAALRQFDDAPVSPAVAPAIDTLDRSAAQIRAALAADPDSVELLQQLRKTYSRRIALTQRGITG